MAKPIDILCFEQAGVGKTTLLEALTSRKLGSSTQLDHETTKLECHEVSETLPKHSGGMVTVNIWFWDSKRIDDWKSNDVSGLFEELEQQNMQPLCMFYCATGNSRVGSATVQQVLSIFVASQTAVFYVITNIFSLSKDQCKGQLDGACNIMTSVTNNQPNKRTEYQYGMCTYIMQILLTIA